MERDTLTPADADPSRDDPRAGRIGYGAMRLTGPDLWGEYPDRDAAIALLRHAVHDLGVTLIDTADVYGPHTNETLIRDALHPYPAGLTLATKGGLVRGGPELSRIAAVGQPDYLRQCVQLSLRRLGLEQIELYYLHSGRVTEVPFTEQVATLAGLREQGLIRHIGLSNVTVEQLRAAREIVDITAVTAHYNAAARAETPLLEATLAGGSLFVPWQPVSLVRPGIETDTTGPAAVRDVLGPIAAVHDATIPQVALAWLLARSPRMLPIPATTDPTHLRQNQAAADLHLTPEQLLQINALAT